MMAAAADACRLPMIPTGWGWLPLATKARIVAGQSPPSSSYNRKGIGLPFFQGKAEFGRDLPTATKWCSRPTKIANKGDVLISVRAPVGPTNFAPSKCAIGRGLAAVQPGPDLDARWLRYWLQFSQSRLVEKATGTTFEAITGDVLRAHRCPFPEIDVQRRIVARITELFSDLDDSEEELARAREELEIYRKSLLKAAVRGNLTTNWRIANPPKEHGADLLARILADRRSRWEADPKSRGKRYKDPVGSAPTKMGEIPAEWVWASYDQCCETLSDRGLKLKERDYLPEGKFPVIDQGSQPVAGYTDDETLLQPVEQPWILFGDHTRRFKLVGQPFCIGADGIKLIRPDRNLNPEYLWRFFQGAHFEDRGYSRHFQFVRGLNIPLPPVDEQVQIVKILAEHLSEAEEVSQAAIEIQQTRSATLRQSILAAAFRGELIQ